MLDLRKGASGRPAEISIDTRRVTGALPTTLWQNLSQGGEEPTDMIQPVIAPLRAITPKLIRVDHLFDYYQVFQGPGNFDFSKLDPIVNSIIATGAQPLLSISYTTAAMSENGQNAGAPKDWHQWSDLVKATAHRYSVEKKISGIYYEVWNEPDLFGNWYYGGNNKSRPNYLTLYSYTSRAIRDGASGSTYKVGGPAITAFYKNWFVALIKTASQNNLPLDFISWHRYSKNMADYEKDFNDLNDLLTDYPNFQYLERLITEVGPNPEPDPWYDNSLSGIHLISLSTRLAGKIHRVFTFEPIDGPNPRAGNNTGWGLITHSNNGLQPKPRYYAFTFLNQMSGLLLPSEGNGSWVTSLASRDGTAIKVLLVNYDPRGSHAETFPLTLTNLTPGKYQLKTTRYLGTSTTKTINISTSYRENRYLPTNTAELLEFTPTK